MFRWSNVLLERTERLLSHNSITGVPSNTAFSRRVATYPASTWSSATCWSNLDRADINRTSFLFIEQSPYKGKRAIETLTNHYNTISDHLSSIVFELFVNIPYHEPPPPPPKPPPENPPPPLIELEEVAREAIAVPNELEKLFI